MPNQNRQQTAPACSMAEANPRTGPVSGAFEPARPRSHETRVSGLYRLGQQQAETRNSYGKPPLQQQQEGRPRNSSGKPQLSIRYAGLSIRRMIVASEDPCVAWSTKLLRFRPFSQTSFAHLSGESLYALAVNHGPKDPPESGRPYLCAQLDGSNQRQSFKEHMSACEVAELVVGKFYLDMSVALNYVKSYLESRFWFGMKPKLWLRLGTMLFHSRQYRFNLAEHPPFGGEALERSLFGGRGLDCSVLKTFDSGISEDYFRKIRALLIGGGGSQMSVNKEKFIIQVADATQPGVTLLCICKRSMDGERTRLILGKVQTDPLRHMVADFACMEKKMDLRLILTTKQEYKGGKFELKMLVEKAVYDVNAEGGISWPLGSTSSGPYSVMGFSHVLQTSFVSNKQKWKLRHANRSELKTSTGRFSYEIDVTSDDWIEQFKIWKEVYDKKDYTKDGCQKSDSFSRPLSNLIEWVWARCL